MSVTGSTIAYPAFLDDMMPAVAFNLTLHDSAVGTLEGLHCPRCNKDGKEQNSQARAHGINSCRERPAAPALSQIAPALCHSNSLKRQQ